MQLTAFQGLGNSSRIEEIQQKAFRKELLAVLMSMESESLNPSGDFSL